MDINNHESKQKQKEEAKQNNAFKASQKMHDVFTTGNLKEYRKAFYKYIHDPTVVNHFYYNVRGPATNHHFPMYPFCKCHSANDVEDIWYWRGVRGRASLPCKCANGKYYLLLHDAYTSFFKSSRHNCSIPEMEKNEYPEDRISDPLCNEIIQWLLNLPSRNNTYKLMKDWNRCHIENYGPYNHCVLCDLLCK